MSQENLQTMIMQIFGAGGGGGIKEVCYGIVQVVNFLTNYSDINMSDIDIAPSWEFRSFFFFG